jgi:hypothetical protein
MTNLDQQIEASRRRLVAAAAAAGVSPVEPHLADDGPLKDAMIAAEDDWNSLQRERWATENPQEAAFYQRVRPY